MRVGEVAIHAFVDFDVESFTSALLTQYLDFADDSVVAVLPHALRIGLRAGLFEQLADGPLGTAELCERTGTEELPVRRLLRALGAVGIVTMLSSDKVELSASGRRLLAAEPGNSSESLSHVDSERAWLAASSVLANGAPSFAGPHGDEFFKHKEHVPEAAASFRTRMLHRAMRLYGGFADLVDWPEHGTVLDIGGGDGFVIGTVLNAAPTMSGVLFDRAVDTGVRPHARCAVVRGDFFASVPPGAATHLLCSVLHDWRDEDAVRILRNSRNALEPGGRLLIVEMVLPDDGRWHPAVWSDLSMMVLTGGRERTEAEFDAILAAAGYRMTGTTPIPGTWFLAIEAR